MAVPALLKNLFGKWQGTNKLWLSPDEPVRISETMAEIRPIAQGRFAEMHYTWADEGQPQDGLLVVGQGIKGAVKAMWVDSWHMGHQFMALEGKSEPNGIVRVTGSYAAPSGPDWSWEIAIEPGGDENSFRFVMVNITPEGERALAVEVIYSLQA